MDQWQESVGRVREDIECLHEDELMGLATLLDYSQAWPDQPAPPFAHWLKVNAPVRQSELGEDGHAKRGLFLPDLPFPRRMWAGSSVRLLKDYEAGQPLRHRQEIKSVQAKSGRSGDMVFVAVQHDYFAADTLVLQERQNLVYRAAAAGGEHNPPLQPKPEADILSDYQCDWWRVIYPDPVLLFRYSAATANGHRIHYDRDYAKNVERYPGLVVHGPLVATLLVDLYQRNNARQRVDQFEFKSTGPLFDIAPFYIMGSCTQSGAKMWAVDGCGKVAMEMQLAAS